MWDVKDALLIRAGWKVSSGIPLCWKMLILQNWNIHRNMLISLKVSMESRHAGCPGSLHSWSHASPGSPAPRSPGSCSSSFLTPRPGLYLGSGVAGGRQAWKGGGTDSQVGSLAAAFLWKFSFLYKNTNSSGKITINSFHRREILFSRLIYQWGDTASLCFLFAYASHILTNMILGGRYPVCSHWNSNAAGSAWGVYSLW